MTVELVNNIIQNAMMALMMISAPMLLASLVVGLVISIFQAATQINEMTLSFIPKLFALFFTLIFAGPWMINTLIDYTLRLYQSIPKLIG